MTLGPANLASPSPRCLENIRVFQMATGRSTLQPRSGSEWLRDWGFCSDVPAVRLPGLTQTSPRGANTALVWPREVREDRALPTDAPFLLDPSGPFQGHTQDDRKGKACVCTCRVVGTQPRDASWEHPAPCTAVLAYSQLTATCLLYCRTDGSPPRQDGANGSGT